MERRAFALYRLRSSGDLVAARESVRALEAGLERRIDGVIIRAEVARALQLLGAWERAIPHLRRALELTADGAEQARLHVQIGLCAYALDDVRGALRSYREALRLDPQCVRGLTALGELYLAAEDLEAAVEQLRRVLELDRENAHARHQYDRALRPAEPPPASPEPRESRLRCALQRAARRLRRRLTQSKNEPPAS